MDLAYHVLAAELVIMILAIFSIIIARTIRNIKERRMMQRRESLHKIFTKALLENRLIALSEIPQSIIHYPDLLTVLEDFDHLFLDTLWIQMKERLVDGFLFKKAIAFLKETSWRNNLLGLRCIALDAQRLLKTSKNRSLVLTLLDHDKFIVRQMAAICLIRTEDKELIHCVVKKMVTEYPMAQYPYRDQFIKGNKRTLSILKELADQEQNPQVIAALLDILSTKLTGNLVPLAAKHRGSKDDSCRLAAVKIFSSIPGEASELYLCEALADSNENIRAEAAKGLGKIVAVNSIPALTLALRDKGWVLRLEAAIALKSLGAPGKAALFAQDQYDHPEAYKAARFVLSIP